VIQRHAKLRPALTLGAIVRIEKLVVRTRIHEAVSQLIAISPWINDGALVDVHQSQRFGRLPNGTKETHRMLVTSSTAHPLQVNLGAMQAPTVSDSEVSGVSTLRVWGASRLDGVRTHDVKHVGRFMGDVAHGPDGRYLGEVRSGNRLIADRARKGLTSSSLPFEPVLRARFGCAP
jgi:hypothetical protein